MLVDPNKLDDSQRRRILKKLEERLGLSQAARQLGISRSTLYRYINGSQGVPLDVIKSALEMLAIDDIIDGIYGTRIVDVDATTAISVIIKAVKDEKFRNFFLSLLYQNLGDYLKETASVYIVSENEVKKFEKVLEDRSKSTKDMRIRYLRKALSNLGYELSPDGIRELLLELREESTNIARHTANSLKLFIKTIVAEKNLPLAQTLYNSFRVPKSVYKYRPKPLSIGDLKKIFDHIEHLGAKAFFLMLAETGLRVGEVYSLKIDQVDLENRIIKIMKESRTKRAYISFLH
ncbi:MAG: tyrosine-type recombinase/integrase, partial [Metallosphaera sp.]